MFLRNVAIDGIPNGKKHVEYVESTLNVAVEHLICGVEVLLTILLFCGMGASFITNLVGFGYPAVMTIRAIESETKVDDTEWLIYWVVFATFNLVDPFVGTVVIYWIPFFYPLKVSFLLWMMLPQTKGANVVFQLVAPHLGKIAHSLSLFMSNEMPRVGADSKKKK